MRIEWEKVARSRTHTVRVRYKRDGQWYDFEVTLPGDMPCSGKDAKETGEYVRKVMRQHGIIENEAYGRVLIPAL